MSMGIKRKLKNMDLNELRQNVILTDSAVRWVTSQIKPICATDFIGYLLDASSLFKCKPQKIGCAVDVLGEFRVFSLDESKPSISNDKVLSIYTRLISDGFLKIDDSVFPQFELGRNIPIDAKRTTMVELPIFIHSGGLNGNDALEHDFSQTDDITIKEMRDSHVKKTCS